MAAFTKIVKIFFLLLGLVLLFLPLWQKERGLVEEPKLKGAIKEIAPVEWTWEGWWEDSLQVQTERYLNQNFGFRKTMVRLNNQLAYWLYRKALAREVVVGKDDWLYESGYIDAVNGDDYKGEKRNRFLAEGTKKVSDMLARSGKMLLVVMAPSKAYVYPEYIPDHLLSPEKKPTNYEDFARMLPEENVLHIDGNKWFKAMRDTASHPLYPKTGIHWSFYGKYLMVDSMLHLIENEIQADLPDLEWNGIEMKDSLDKEDKDLENGLNLLFPIPNHPMPYPKVKIERQDKRLLNNVTIADSYWWTIFGHGIAGRIFNQSPEFWYYFREVHGGPENNEKEVPKLDMAKALADKDLVIILCTEPKLREFSWKFIDKLLADKTFEERLYRESMEHAKNLVRSSAAWMEGTAKQAAERGISVDSMVVLAAAHHLKTKMQRR